MGADPFKGGMRVRDVSEEGGDVGAWEGAGAEGVVRVVVGRDLGKNGFAVCDNGNGSCSGGKGGNSSTGDNFSLVGGGEVRAAIDAKGKEVGAAKRGGWEGNDDGARNRLEGKE